MKTERTTKIKLDDKEERDGITGMLELADQVISLNRDPMVTLIVAFGMYKIALK